MPKFSLFPRKPEKREASVSLSDLYGGVGVPYDLGDGVGVQQNHPAFMIPSSLHSIKLLTRAIVGATPMYQEEVSPGVWRQVEDRSRIPDFLRPYDRHPNPVQTYDEFMTDIVVSLIISHGSWVVSLNEPGQPAQQIQSIPAWSGTMDTNTDTNGQQRIQLRVGSGSVPKAQQRVYDRYNPGTGGSYLYMSELRWGNLPYGVDSTRALLKTLLKILSSIDTGYKFAKNPMPPMILEGGNPEAGQGGSQATSEQIDLEKLMEDLKDAAADPDKPKAVLTNIVIRAIHHMYQPLSESGITEVIKHAPAEMASAFGISDDSVNSPDSSKQGSAIRDNDRIMLSHSVYPIKRKIERALSMMLSLIHI